MIFDTDVLVFLQRGNPKAAQEVQKTKERFISALTYMELLQDAKNKQQHLWIINFLKEFQFTILPLSENIGYRASVYVEEYSLSSGIRAGDAIIAATAIEAGLPLLSANKKHFKAIKEIELNIFKP